VQALGGEHLRALQLIDKHPAAHTSDDAGGDAGKRSPARPGTCCTTLLSSQRHQTMLRKIR
jgi:hypothetical protein